MTSMEPQAPDQEAREDVHQHRDDQQAGDQRQPPKRVEGPLHERAHHPPDANDQEQEAVSR